MGGFLSFYYFFLKKAWKPAGDRAEAWKCVSWDFKDRKQVKISLDLFTFQIELFSQPHKTLRDWRMVWIFFFTPERMKKPLTCPL